MPTPPAIWDFSCPSAVCWEYSLVLCWPVGSGRNSCQNRKRRLLRRGANACLLYTSEPRWYALCIPGDSSYATLFPYVSFEEQSQLYEKRNSMTPFLVEVNTDLSANGVYTYTGARRYLPNPIARHLIGYLNGEGVGVSGLELAYEDVLAQAGEERTVCCATTAQGSLMTGTQPEIQAAAGTNQGVQLTLDANLQRACEGIAAQTMERGCILVMDTETGEILASVSMPEFDPDDLVTVSYTHLKRYKNQNLSLT